jgi:peptide/nickel transport system substrate-binding protein
MSEMPSGTVTFLFTDIEGSTKLVKLLGSEYGAALADHQRIIREAAEARGGREVDTQGDSFFFVFARANAALGAAVVAQHALAEHAWPAGIQIRVRMGLHTGEPVVDEERYLGLGVHRAARIGSVGHGGQVLLSNATRELVEDAVGGVAVRELGRYRLRDIDEPERLFQLDIDGLQTEFAPLKTEKVAEPTTVKRRTVLQAALAGILAVAVAALIFTLARGDDNAIEAAAGNSVGVVDPESGDLVADVPTGVAPATVAFGAGAAWVTNPAAATVDRIDPSTRTVRQTIDVGRGPDDIVFGAGSVWVTNGLDGTVSRIDPGSNEVVDTVSVGSGPTGIAFGLGSIWIVNRDDHTLVRLAPTAGSVVRRIPAGTGPTDVAVGAGAVWVTNTADGTVLRVDPRSGAVVEAINVGRGPVAVAVGEEAVWVANSLDGTVSRIDPETSTVRDTIEVGEGPSGIAVGSGSIWVTNEFSESLSRIDPASNAVSKTISIGARPAGLAIDAAGVYVAVRPAGEAHRGGTLTFLDVDVTPDAYSSFDPIVFSPGTTRLLPLTNDGLTAFKRVGGLEGAEVVPNLAVSIPRPTDGGRTYTFRLRPEIRYSTGAPVRASDFRHALERQFALESFATFLFGSVMGAAACIERPGQCDLSSGIVADDVERTVTVRLVEPDSELPTKLATQFAVAVPSDTPMRDLGNQPLPATGPYMIATYARGKQVRLVRNPRFREWTPTRPAGYVDEIVIRLGVPERERIRAVARGDADAASLGRATGGSTDLARLRARYGSRLHSNPTSALLSIQLDTRLPPFDDVRVRRALNLAVDRDAVVRAAGGSEWAAVSCQVLPPNSPGYEPYCPYERNLVEAKRLVAESGTAGAAVTVMSREFQIHTMKPVLAALRALGYRTRSSIADDDAYFRRLTSGNVHAVSWAWVADYPSSAAWVQSQFSCLSLREGGSNFSKFCNRAVEREIARGVALQASDPPAANEIWTKVDRMITDQAPAVSLVTSQLPYFIAERVGNYQYHPVFEVLLDQLWVR